MSFILNNKHKIMNDEIMTSLSVGDTLPEMDLPAYDPKKDEVVTIKTGDYKAKKWLIFFFYPADFTFVCPTELEELAEEIIFLLEGSICFAGKKDELIAMTGEKNLERAIANLMVGEKV